MEVLNAFQLVRAQRLSQGYFHSDLSLLQQLPADYQFSHETGPLGDSIFVEISAKLLPTLALPHDTVSCEVQLPPQYPLSPPVLLCHTPFLTPSIADGRDLIGEVLEGTWEKDKTVKAVVEAIPRFLVIFI